MPPAPPRDGDLPQLGYGQAGVLQRTPMEEDMATAGPSPGTQRSWGFRLEMVGDPQEWG